MQLKPRLQNILLDIIFKGIYKDFHFILENTSVEFKREVFRNAKYEQFGDLKDDENPTEMFPDHLHFFIDE